MQSETETFLFIICTWHVKFLYKTQCLVASRGPFLETDRVDLDETIGVLGVVAALLIHGGFAHIVQLGTVAAGNTAFNDGVTLVELELDITGNVALGEGNGLVQELALGREVLTVVQGTRVGDSDVLVTQGTELAIKSETFQILVSSAKDGATGSFVATAGFDTNEAGLDNVDTTNTVATSDSVEVGEKGNRFSDLGVVVVVHNLDGNTLFEGDGDAFGSVGSILRINSELPHILGRSDIGVLKDTSLVRDVEQVFVSGPGLGSSLDNRNALLGGVSQQIRATGETLKEDYRTSISKRKRIT